MNRGSIIVSVHADDEIYQAASFIFNYPFKILMHVPFLGDMSRDQDSLLDQKSMLSASLSVINKYRSMHKFEPIELRFLGFGYRPNGLYDEEFRYAVTQIEDSLKEFDKIDYYIRTCESTHQNHCNAFRISNAVLRSPYIDKIDNILTSYYPTDFSVGDVGHNTAFQDMDEEQVNIACTILDSVYSPKVVNRKSLSSESFKLLLKFMGSVSQNEYAQTYQIDRLRMYGAKYNNSKENV